MALRTISQRPLATGKGHAAGSAASAAPAGNMKKAAERTSGSRASRSQTRVKLTGAARSTGEPSGRIRRVSMNTESPPASPARATGPAACRASPMAAPRAVAMRSVAPIAASRNDGSSRPAAEAEMRKALRDVDANLPITSYYTFKELEGIGFIESELMSRLCALFAMIALFAGAFIAKRVVLRLDATAFHFLIEGLMLIAGLSMIWGAFQG